MSDFTPKSELEIATNAKRLYSTLCNGLRSGDITESHAIHGDEIAEKATKSLRRPVKDTEVRSWVNYLRAKLKIPVGSSGEGYFLCSSRAQWIKTKKALLGRIKNQQEAAYGPDEFYDKQEQLSLLNPPTAEGLPPIAVSGDLMNHPVVQELGKQFGAVPV